MGSNTLSMMSRFNDVWWDVGRMSRYILMWAPRGGARVAWRGTDAGALGNAEGWEILCVRVGPRKVNRDLDVGCP